MGVVVEKGWWYVAFQCRSPAGESVRVHRKSAANTRRAAEELERKLRAQIAFGEYKCEREKLKNSTRVVYLGGLDPTALGWAVERWSRMNYKERFAVIFTRDAGRCVYCKHEVTVPLARTKRLGRNRGVLDHRIPVSGGGSDALDNMVLSCNRCNIMKCDK